MFPPSSCDALSGLGEIPHIDSVRVGAGAVDGGVTEDGRPRGVRVADNDGHVAVQVERIGGSLVLVLLLTLDVAVRVRHRVAAEVGSIKVVRDDPAAVRASIPQLTSRSNS